MIESTSNSFKGFFWKIEDAKGNKGYVLGSIHMGSDDLLEINPKIMKCFFIRTFHDFFVKNGQAQQRVI